MSDFLFKDRDGQTPLPEELKKGLIPKHIQTMGELDEYEEENIAEGLIWLNNQSKDPVDLLLWCLLHKKLFSSVWTWAGRFRKHELDNTDFHQPYEIRPDLKKLEGDVNFWISNETYDPTEIACRFHEKLLTIHPFANGNGRWSRILVEYFCQYHNIEKPAWGRNLGNNPSQRRKRYIDALLKARRKLEFDDLKNFIFQK